MNTRPLPYQGSALPLSYVGAGSRGGRIRIAEVRSPSGGAKLPQRRALRKCAIAIAVVQFADLLSLRYGSHQELAKPDGAMGDGDRKSAADERSERLAKALRDNLRRRKDQARGRRAENSPEAFDNSKSAPDDT